MAIEIERKFLVKDDTWTNHINHMIYIEQFYIHQDPAKIVRIRIVNHITAFLTIKGLKIGFSAPEFEYEIPVNDAIDMRETLPISSTVSKTRYIVIDDNDQCWEVDVFRGRNTGLIVAELEMEHSEVVVHFPTWIGNEVTDDPRYSNSALETNPMCEWGVK